MNEKEFGLKVKQLRQERGLTREEFCLDETELTTRQLARIEAGGSKPNLKSINYIAERLGYSTYELMPDYVALPAQYKKLKYEILRRPTYGHEGLLDQKDEILREIYDDYYADLPADEQLAIDAYAASLDILHAGDPIYAQKIMEENVPGISGKDDLTINDLVVVRLFFIWLDKLHEADPAQIEGHRSILENLIEKLPNQKDNYDLEELFILRDILIALIVHLGRFQVSLDRIPELFDVVDELMEQTHDLQKKPVVLLLKWTYLLTVEGDKEGAYQCYQDAVQLATLLGEEQLVKVLENSWKIDTKEYM